MIEFAKLITPIVATIEDIYFSFCPNLKNEELGIGMYYIYDDFQRVRDEIEATFPLLVVFSFVEGLYVLFPKSSLKKEILVVNVFHENESSIKHLIGRHGKNASIIQDTVNYQIRDTEFVKIKRIIFKNFYNKAGGIP